MTYFNIRQDVDDAGTANVTPTTALFMEMLATACVGGNPMRQAVQVARLKQLIAVRAWSDAALALVALRLPEWKLRRLVYDGGEWYCALSPHPETPDWLDDTVEAHHPNMALAIVGALLDACNLPQSPHLSAFAIHDPGLIFTALSCENYS